MDNTVYLNEVSFEVGFRWRTWPSPLIDALHFQDLSFGGVGDDEMEWEREREDEDEEQEEAQLEEEEVQGPLFHRGPKECGKKVEREGTCGGEVDLVS